MQKVVGSNPISRLPRLIAPRARKPRGTHSPRGLVVRLARDSAPWRSGYAAACKAVYTGSIPVGASTGFARTIWGDSQLGAAAGAPKSKPATALPEFVQG